LDDWDEKMQIACGEAILGPLQHGVSDLNGVLLRLDSDGFVKSSDAVPN
jgi:hypothetical protein